MTTTQLRCISLLSFSTNVMTNGYICFFSLLAHYQCFLYIHTNSAVNIDSVEINTSLILIRYIERSRLKQPCSPCSLFDNFLPIFPLHSQRIFKCHNEIWGKGIDFRCPKIILVGLCEAHKTLGVVAITDFWAVFAGTRYVPLCQGNYNRKLSEVVHR